MRIVVDENLSRELVQQLQQQGHRVWFVPDVQPGLKNGEVLDYANQQQALLITGRQVGLWGADIPPEQALFGSVSRSAPSKDGSNPTGSSSG